MTAPYIAPCLMAKEQGALVMVHAENGDVIDYLIGQALAEGNTDPIYHALNPSFCAGRRSDWPGGEADGTRRFAALCGACHLRRGSTADRGSPNQGLEVWGETCPQYLLLDQTYLETAGLRRCQICMVAASARSLASRCAVECTEEWTAADGRL